jgi:hypothetical protein
MNRGTIPVQKQLRMKIRCDCRTTNASRLGGRDEWRLDEIFAGLAHFRLEPEV